MCHTSANVHYWSAVVDVFVCIDDYIDSVDNRKECEERYNDLLDAIEVARSSYVYCEDSHIVPFGMDDDRDVASFISLMIKNPAYYERCRQRAIRDFSHGATAVPLRSL